MCFGALPSSMSAEEGMKGLKRKFICAFKRDCKSKTSGLLAAVIV